jgi:hypothetical protein
MQKVRPKIINKQSMLCDFFGEIRANRRRRRENSENVKRAIDRVREREREREREGKEIDRIVR